MFDILFGWRKASKCQKLVRRLQCRLKLLKNKRHAIVRQLREDVAELIKYGYEDSALNRVEQLIIDESTVEVYESLDQFCEFILVNFSYIRRHRDCPNDIREAVSSLIYASPRFGDLPELIVIRKLFAERYGQKFTTTAVELLPGNLVDFQIKEKLSLNPIHDDLKYRVLDQIGRDYCLRPELLALDYYSGWQETKVKENAGFKERPSDFEEKGREVLCVDSTTQKLLTGPCGSFSQQGSHLTDVSDGIPGNQQTRTEKLAKVNSSYNFTVYAMGESQEKVLPSAASFPWFPKRAVVYFDDIEEVQSSVSKNGGLQDQRLFMFRTRNSRAGEAFDSGCDESNADYNGLSSERSSCRRSLTKRRRLHGSKRRSATLGIQCTEDIGCMIYYYKPYRSLTSHTRKHQKLQGNTPLGTDICLCQCIHDEKRPLSNLKARDCSLDHPCYLSVCEGKRKTGTLVGFKAEVQQEILLARCGHCNFWNVESDEETGLVAFPDQKLEGRDSENVDVAGKVVRYLDYQNEKQNKEKEEETANRVDSSLASDTCSARLTAASARKETQTQASYSRAMTMPPERPRENQKDNISRTNSCPPQNPSHVHPKLPEYDDIAAKFMALKKAHQNSNQHVT